MGGGGGTLQRGEAGYSQLSPAETPAKGEVARERGGHWLARTCASGPGDLREGSATPLDLTPPKPQPAAPAAPTPLHATSVQPPPPARFHCTQARPQPLPKPATQARRSSRLLRIQFSA
ncbi:unnamed protein product [Rangifer tarandus platyrhynchus]|uniref:Uncharacterized protein n=2 Tax=Rangifer tarandus platyrhynchus TaxID=3082113 RepID=A0ACB0F3I1_RANTA|nr:unnamed protein product [Rangifer tarandus platyrhynchus]CAI9707486.1 unnamed protein product [Rangifer tarandus platyrhynchus]